MKTLAVIPARMSSTRFPDKPLAPILGLPMIEHVRRRTALAKSLDQVVVATCDREIVEVVQSHGGLAAMTSPKHERGTDRVAEAAQDRRADIVVNVQGDEPLIQPGAIDAVIAPLLEDPALLCANLMAPIKTREDFESSDVVKTVVDLKNNALYFSREPVPSRAKAGSSDFAKYKQLGIIAFRADFLRAFTRLPPTPLEIVESVDMMRALEHGHPVRMVLWEEETIGVDRPKDLEKAERLLRKDPWIAKYHPQWKSHAR